jgi:hypothetical protein
MSDGGDPIDSDSPHAGAPPPQTPLGLDYFAPHKAHRRLSRSVEFGVGLIIVGWLPFACGIINVMVAGNSYSPAVIGSHKTGAVLFLALGVATSAAGLFRLISLRHVPGMFFGAIVLAVQLSVASCLGIAYVTGR